MTRTVSDQRLCVRRRDPRLHDLLPGCGAPYEIKAGIAVACLRSAKAALSLPSLSIHRARACPSTAALRPTSPAQPQSVVECRRRAMCHPLQGCGTHGTRHGACHWHSDGTCRGTGTRRTRRTAVTDARTTYCEVALCTVFVHGYCDPAWQRCTPLGDLNPSARRHSCTPRRDLGSLRSRLRSLPTSHASSRPTAMQLMRRRRLIGRSPPAVLSDR